MKTATMITVMLLNVAVLATAAAVYASHTNQTIQTLNQRILIEQTVARALLEQ